MELKRRTPAEMQEYYSVKMAELMIEIQGLKAHLKMEKATLAQVDAERDRLKAELSEAVSILEERFGMSWEPKEG